MKSAIQTLPASSRSVAGLPCWSTKEKEGALHNSGSAPPACCCQAYCSAGEAAPRNEYASSPSAAASRNAPPKTTSGSKRQKREGLGPAEEGSEEFIQQPASNVFQT